MASSKEIAALLGQLRKLTGRPCRRVEGSLLISSGNPGDGRYYYLEEIVGTSGQHHCSPRCTAAEMVLWLKGALWAAEEAAGGALAR